MKHPTILTFGNVVMDGLYRVKSLPGRDEKVFAESAAWSPGGPAVHFALTAAALGVSSAVLGWVGADSFGRQIEEALRKRGVSPLFERVPDALTPTVVVTIDKTGEKAALLSPPIGKERLSVARLMLGVDFALSSHLHTHLYHEEFVLRMLEAAKRQEVSTSLDVEPSSVERWGIGAVRRALSLVDIAFFNERSVHMLATEPGGMEAKLRSISAAGPSIAVCLSGAGGAYVYASGQLIHCPAIPVTVINSLGAGDIFSASFVCAILSGRTAESAAAAATAAAAVSVSRSLDTVYYPTAEDVERMMEKIPSFSFPRGEGRHGDLHER